MANEYKALQAIEAAASIANPNMSCFQADDLHISKIPKELIRSLEEHIEVVVLMRDHQEEEELKVVGTVEYIDQQGARFRVDGEWFDGYEIEAIYLRNKSE